ncbi:TPA: MFS transporter [Enterobacter hormaechei subsp. xiangfangensis]|nr:MFS transporter [Enterobacter hormaechei subsp. xiangfangensis]
MNSSKSLVLTAAITSMGYVVVQLDVTIVNIALPTFARVFDTNTSLLQWVPDSYVIVFAALLLAAGGLSDRFGSRNINVIGMVIFLLASLGCAFSSSIEMMIASRVFQGVGAALILPSSLALLANSSADNMSRRTKAIGWWSAIGGVISAAGPFIGGVIIENYSWDVIFLINVPVCVLGIFLTLLYVDEPVVDRLSKVDVKGVSLFVITSFSFVYFVIGMGGGESYFPKGFAIFFVFVISLCLLSRHFIYDENPFIPRELFKSPIFNIGLIVGAALNLSFYGSIFLITIYFQVYRNFSPAMTGLALLTFMIIALANTVSGTISERFGSRFTISIGIYISGFSYLILSILTYFDASYMSFVIGLFLMPIGGGVALPTLISTFIQESPKNMTATASAAINAMRQLGGALGVAFLGILVSETHFSIRIGTVLGFIISGCLMFVCAYVVTLKLTSCEENYSRGREQDGI